MEASTAQQPPQLEAPAMDTSMDIDMDLDLGPAPESEAIETDPMNVTTTAPDGVVDPQTAEAHFEKVHVRGVDELTTDDIRQFATSHFPFEQPARIEWIDDTSANIVYSSSEVGLQALSALTQVSEEEQASELPVLRLRSAKFLSTHPDAVLQVRSAVKTDRKKPRAHEASRFYLMHPEHDPREKLRRELEEKRSYGGDTSDGDYRRRRFDGRELRRRRDRDADEGISANMYDDTRPPSSDYSDGGRGRGGRGRREHRELFPEDGRLSGRLRNRSASPGRDTLMDDDDNRDTRRRFRQRSAHGRLNEGKELFPSGGGDGDAASRELFPNKTTNSYLKKELFPSKVSNHRRTDAIDATEETDQRNRNVELFPDSTKAEETRDVNIRGAAAQDQGFSIRGAANGISIKGRGASVRELFPSKYSSNTGKELFTSKLEGRGGPRRKAEDMFG